jgi:formylglycine-generating enzyme required for sulfatase activity
MRPLRVFLCHASQDKPAVWKLYRYLKQRGVKPWLDQADLLPGENWEVEIPNALFSSDVILVCLSKNSVDKEGYVQKEISFALDKALEKPEGTIFVIPVKLEECELPRRLNRYQWVELFRPDGRKRLLMGLNKRVKGLAPDVSPVILEDTRRRRPVSEPVMDQAGREAGENAARARAEREAAEGLAREKAAREKREREQKERTDREAKEFARRQTEARAPEKEKLETPKPKGPVPKPPPKFAPRLFGLGGVILIGLVFWGISALLNDQPTATPPEKNTATAAASVATQTPTKVPPTTTNTSVPPTFTPAPGIGSTMISEKDGMVMVFVPAGEFTMGGDSYSDEQPIHQVNLDAFWIDQTEVTNAMYAKCVDDGGCTPPSSSRSYTHDSYYGNSTYNNYPVIYVNWNQANAYCGWARRRLLTEAEWEKAARGTDGRIYPWGESISCSMANYWGNDGGCIGDTTEVGEYPAGASIYGAYDMAGNVWEWVSSLYQSYPYSANDGRENLGASGLRVLRGGSWLGVAHFVRSANRQSLDPAVTDFDFGFRCSLGTSP